VTAAHDKPIPVAGGCPPGYEPIGIMITKSGLAYLVGEDDEGNAIFQPLY
jgi:hypothetical protein